MTRQRGFSLVELVLVMTILGVIGAMATIFFKPAMDAFFATTRRAAILDMADTALRKIGRDVRVAVPNSLRIPSSQCFELVPTSTGGRYRMAVDTVNAGSVALDIDAPVTTFDVLSPMTTMPVANDWVVINNQYVNDVYAGVNASQIILGGVTTPASAAGLSRLTVNAIQFPTGYTGGRFSVVPGNGLNPALFYVCSGADGSLDSSGNGKGTLYRLARPFVAAYPTSCPATAGAAVVASNVTSCNFIYDASQDGTQQSALLWMQLKITQGNESADLVYGVHVDNVP
jgi:MSHA biogenesis protein MshO